MKTAWIRLGCIAAVIGMMAAATAQNKGPNGEPATWASEVTLNHVEINQMNGAGYKAALLWAGSGEWYNALSKGAEEEFKKLGVTVVIKSDAQFNPEKQATDVETCLALKPDIILTLVVDPVSGARALAPAVDAGVCLVLADNGVDGYTAGNQYVSVVTGDHFGMGRMAAELINDALAGKGQIGFLYHDADFFVTNNRDREFKRCIQDDFPEIQIAAEAGFTEESRTEEVASAMLIRHSKIKGLYVSWDLAAEGVIAALRAAGRRDVKVVTHDLGATNDLDMAMKGNMVGKVIDNPYVIGATMAKVAALKLLGEQAPPFIIVPSMKVQRNNVINAWRASLRKEPPKHVMRVMNRK